MKQNSKNQIHVHIDADAFFSSVEQVLHRELAGKPLVVGQNGGIVSAMSYPAKKMGISRVLPIVSVRKKYPTVHIVASDFHAYGIFSQRIDNIVRNHFPNLVKNSVDEGSINMTQWVDTFKEAEEKVISLQNELSVKLGCTFSFGIARTPLLAKLASGMNKPNGITVLDDENVEEKIHHIPVNYISGIGKSGYAKLLKYNIKTIGDFAKANPEWLCNAFSISMPKLQKQIRGEVVDIPKQKDGIKSMSRDRSFGATEHYSYLYSQMSMNIEHLAQRMRKENVFTKRIGLRLRDQDLTYTESFITLTSPTRNPESLLVKLEKLLQSLYQKGVLYRQVSVTCAGLTKGVIQYDLFSELETSQKKNNVLDMIDGLENKFGKSCIGLASSLKAKEYFNDIYSRHEPNDTYPHPLLPKEEPKKRLRYPFLGLVT